MAGWDGRRPEGLEAGLEVNRPGVGNHTAAFLETREAPLRTRDLYALTESSVAHRESIATICRIGDRVGHMIAISEPEDSLAPIEDVIGTH